MNTKISVSVIVPVFNTELYLGKCLQSLVDQTINNDIEIIIIDDGSTDGSLQIAKYFSNKFKNIQVFTKKNEGQGLARNFGIQKAIGEYICYVDSDDWVESTLCEDMVKILDETNVDFVNFGADFFTPNGSIVKKIKCFTQNELSGEIIFDYALIDKEILSISWNKIYRRSFLLTNKILFPSIRVNEDLFYSRAVAYYAFKTSFVSKIYYHALVRAGSTSRKMSIDMFQISVDLINYEKLNFSERLKNKTTQIYFNAHIIKFLSYMLIQSAFRISKYSEFILCFDVVEVINYKKLCKSKLDLSPLNTKGKITAILCRYPVLLRLMANILKKLGFSSFIY